MNNRSTFMVSALALAVASTLPLTLNAASVTPVISNVTIADNSNADGRGKKFLDDSAGKAPNGWNQWDSSVTSTFTNRAFNSHYKNNIGSNSQVSLSQSWNYLGSHTVTLTITNDGAWELDIDLQRFGLINVNRGSGGLNVGGNGEITVQALTTSITGATIKSGTLNLDADAKRTINSANSYNYTVNQNNTATLQGSGPATVTLVSNFNINTKVTGGTTRNVAVSWVAGQAKQNSDIANMPTATDDQGVKMAGVLRTSIPMNDATAVINENVSNAALHDFNNSETGNDLSFDNKPVSYSIIAGNDAGLFSINASTGQVSIAAGKQLDYETASQYTLTIQASNAGLTNTAQLVVNVNDVNDAPTAAADSAIVNAGQSTTIAVLANDTDEDGDSLSITNVITNGTTGTVSIVGGQISYQATGFDDLLIGQTAQDSFQYEVTDGELSSVATVTVTINGTKQPNRAPVAVGDSATVDAGQSTTIAVLANDTDEDGDSLSITNVITNGTTGTVSIVGGQISYQATGFDDLLIGQTAQDSFQYEVTDGELSSVATVTVTINGTKQPNRAPVAVGDSATVDAGQSTTIAVLANDTDEDGDSLSIANVITNGTTGTVSIVGGQISYQATGFDDLLIGQTAQDSFQYEVTDGELTSVATVTVTINGTKQPNRAPVAVGDSATVDAGQSTTIAVLANDTDEDGDSLSITNVITNGTTGTVSIVGGQISYQATGFDDLLIGQTAQDSFQYEVTDGELTAMATVTVTVNGQTAPNEPPVAVADSYTIDAGAGVTLDVLFNDYDPEQAPLSIEIDTAGTQGAAAVFNNQVIYDPSVFDQLPINSTATDSFQYRVSDGSKYSDWVTVTITINGKYVEPVCTGLTE